jgi:hypothetical protein
MLHIWRVVASEKFSTAAMHGPAKELKLFNSNGI